MVRRVRPFKRAADFEDRLWMTLDEAVPPVVRTHLRSAAKEVLLAVRAMLDHTIEQAGTSARPRRPRRVRVQ